MNIQLAMKVAQVRELVFLTFQHYLSIRAGASLAYNGKLRVSRIRQDIDICRKRQVLLFRSLDQLEGLTVEDQSRLQELTLNLEAMVKRIQVRLDTLEQEINRGEQVLGRKAA